MAKVIGFAQQLLKKITCYNCCAIIEYEPREVQWNGHTDEGCKIMIVRCPNCGNEIRTNY